MNAFIDKFSPSITNMIRVDHSGVLTTFHQYEMDSLPKTKQALVSTACMALEIHTQLEEEIFYPALRAVSNDPLLDRVVPEHDAVRESIVKLRSMEPTDPEFDTSFMKLMQEVIHHVADEETVLLPMAERLLKDQLGELGMQMTKRRLQLAAPHARDIAMNSIRGMPTSSMVMAAGAILAGTYLVRRSFGRHAMTR